MTQPVIYNIRFTQAGIEAIATLLGNAPIHSGLAPLLEDIKQQVAAHARPAPTASVSPPSGDGDNS